MSIEEGQRFESTGSDKNESEPDYRHQVAREDVETPTAAERAEWLDSVWGAGFRGEGDSTKNPMDAAAALEMLQDWQRHVPAEHHGTIRELTKTLDTRQDTGKTIPQIIVESIRYDQWETIGKVQQLCVAVLDRYDSKEGREGWNSLPEASRRYIRVAEMSVLMIDAVKLQRNYMLGEADDAERQHIVERLERYAASSDIPDSFRRGLIEPFARRHEGRKSESEEEPFNDDSSTSTRSTPEMGEPQADAKSSAQQRRGSPQRTDQREITTQGPERVSEQPVEKPGNTTRKSRPASTRRRQAPQWPAGSNPSAPPSPAPGPKP